MKFGKLENGRFVQAQYIQTASQTIYTDLASVWYDNGYKSLNEDAKPADEEGFYFEQSFTEVGNEIVVIYTKKAINNDI